MLLLLPKSSVPVRDSEPLHQLGGGEGALVELGRRRRRLMISIEQTAKIATK